MRKRIRIMSRRPGKSEWGIRDDRFLPGEKTIDQLREEAVRKIIDWQAVEPNTEFRIEEYRG